MQFCMASRRRVHVFQIAAEGVRVLRELYVPSTVLSMCAYAHTLLLAYKREYSVFNVQTGQIKDVVLPVKTSANVRKMIVFLSEEEVLIHAEERLSLFVNFEVGNADTHTHHTHAYTHTTHIGIHTHTHTVRVCV